MTNSLWLITFFHILPPKLAALEPQSNNLLLFHLGTDREMCSVSDPVSGCHTHTHNNAERSLSWLSWQGSCVRKLQTRDNTASSPTGKNGTHPPV